MGELETEAAGRAAEYQQHTNRTPSPSTVINKKQNMFMNTSCMLLVNIGWNVFILFRFCSVAKKVVCFDFDCTITSNHYYKVLAWGYSGTHAKQTILTKHIY